ncbi:hypothetical protein [Cellulomonas sp.]|uniref:hypothetical protein n=1 Tax=Cellulomonas sp. TaxID=40001 RepID=UPI001B1F6D46|nr:hypothetical protein [Cellulomonas sp.]MBO9554794.1 hypothetical protein [Cellulomonas sp.]
MKPDVRRAVGIAILFVGCVTAMSWAARRDAQEAALTAVAAAVMAGLGSWVGISVQRNRRR